MEGAALVQVVGGDQLGDGSQVAVDEDLVVRGRGF